MLFCLLLCYYVCYYVIMSSNHYYVCYYVIMSSNHHSNFCLKTEEQNRVEFVQNEKVSSECVLRFEVAT